MSANQLKLKQLENALLAINQAKFQDLVNHYLHLKGYLFISAPGSVVGKEKTKQGQPDSFFQENDKYVFVEITTKERLGNGQTFLDKLFLDINSCFNEASTHIPAKDVSKVILACTSVIKPNEFEDLRKAVQAHNPYSEIEIINIQNFPFQILDFPALAEEYLGVSLIKGEIYTLKEFLLKTDKGIQPSLTNTFLFREEEIKRGIEYLEKCDIILLSGPQGVGKSKLAVKILECYEEKGYFPIVIQSSMVPLWDDFINLLKPDTRYVILFDDANKSISNFTYLLEIISKTESNKIKLVITVRDYVKHTVNGKLKEFRFNELQVSQFTDDEIEKLILDLLPNLKYHFEIKEKIIRISKGNARMALMATSSVMPDSELNFLDNTVILYEKYFEKVTTELGLFKKPIVLQTLAVISFFGVIERNDEPLSQLLQEHFGIEWEAMWDVVIDLHTFELVDVYASEIVKISDQVLATYAFYQCFLNEANNVLAYSKWIALFLEKYDKRLQNTLTDVNNTFGYQHIKEISQQHIDAAYELIRHNNSLEYQYYKLFWFYKGFATLNYLKKWIGELPLNIIQEGISFNYVHNDHVYPERHFEILMNFWEYPNELLYPALQTSFSLIEKDSYRLPEVLKFMNERFSYKWEDVVHGFVRQNILLDILIEGIEAGELICKGVFLKLAHTLLGWHYTQYTGAKGMAITIRNFNLYLSKELLLLRKKILENLINIFEFDNELSENILSRIVRPDGYIDKLIYHNEITLYESLIAKCLSIKRYAHCKFVKRLIKIFAGEEIAYPKEWDAFVDSEIIKLSQFLKIEWNVENGKGYEERQRDKVVEIKNTVKSNIQNAHCLLLQIEDLYHQLKDNTAYFIEDCVTEVFIALAESEKNLFSALLTEYFNRPIKLPLSYRLVSYILHHNCITPKELLDILEKNNSSTRLRWIASFLYCLPEREITVVYLAKLLTTLNDSTYELPFWSIKDLDKYQSAFEEYSRAHQESQSMNHNVITHITAILLNKRDIYRVSFGWEFFSSCKEYFTNHVPLFKEAYFYNKENFRYSDYEGKEFNAVFELDNSLLKSLITRKLEKEKYPAFRNEDFKLNVVWSSDNYYTIISDTLELIVSRIPIFSNFDHAANILFKVRKQTDDFIAKATSFIEDFINKHHSKKEHILIIINVIQHTFPDHFIRFLRQLFLLNTDLEIFRKMFLTKFGAYSGSRVPHIQWEIDLCNDILTMVKGLPNLLDYSGHIEYLEKMIVWLKKDILEEQKREFREEYDF